MMHRTATAETAPEAAHDVNEITDPKDSGGVYMEDCWSMRNPNLAMCMDVSNTMRLVIYFHKDWGHDWHFQILPSGIQHVVPAAENKTCTKTLNICCCF